MRALLTRVVALVVVLPPRERDLVPGVAGVVRHLAARQRRRDQLVRRAVLAVVALVAGLVLTGTTAAPSQAATNDLATLFLIETRGTASGRVELHTATRESGYRSADLHTTTWFSTSQGPMGYWQVLGRDLWFLKVCNTGSGHWELHSATAASHWTTGAHIVMPVHPAMLPCAQAMAQLDAVGRPKLHLMVPQDAVPDVEIGWRTSTGQTWARAFYNGESRAVLPFRGGRTAFCMLDPYGLRATGTGSAKIEVTRYDSYFWGVDVPPQGNPAVWVRTSVFSAGDAASGVLDMGTQDAWPCGLTLVKTWRTGSGHIEVFAASGADNGARLGVLELASSTWFPLSLAGSGTWQLGSYII